jgi:nucleoside-diphosphate-sugar epimerase
MITVLGASGFIGRHLAQAVRASGEECYAPPRSEALPGRPLGDVIYCVGLTADFRWRPFATVDAHVCTLSKVLQDCDFDSFLYLSSTRVYRRGIGVATEDDAITIAPSDGDDLYSASKVLGESLTLSCGRTARVARLSNVYGADLDSENFLPTVLRTATVSERVTLNSSLDSAKDYIGIGDTVGALIHIATRGQLEIYNVASGTNVSHGALMERISDLTGCAVEVAPGASTVIDAQIDVERLQSELRFEPSSVLEDVEQLIGAFRSGTASR